MLNYTKVTSLLSQVDAADAEQGFVHTVIPALATLWIDDYSRRTKNPEIVQTTDSGFFYLFDIPAGRLVAAWGISRGRHAGARGAARMAGHPLSAGSLYHRGHAIPHTLGGPTDINLVPQLARINIGPFRPLEKKAVSTPGSMYFTYWCYPPNQSAPHATQTPTGVDQGLLIAGQPPQITRHGN